MGLCLELRGADGVTLDDVSLDNYGTLRVGDSPGIADVAAFNNFDTGILEIEISGYALGSEYDHFLVGDGPANLDGTLNVSLTDIGSGTFLPEVGDQFMILSALDGVVGTFDNSPVSFVGSTQYHWEVLYGSHNVTLRLDFVAVPEPSGFLAIFGLVLPFTLRRNRTV